MNFRTRRKCLNFSEIDPMEILLQSAVCNIRICKLNVNNQFEESFSCVIAKHPSSIKKKTMKKILAALVLTGIIQTATVKAQNTQVNPYPKTISVSGSAELEIIPDEIYVQVDLREYEKKGSGKIDLETIKKNFLVACKTIGLPDSAISVASYNGYDRNYWLIYKKKKNPDLIASITYQIKFNSVSKMDDLVKLLDDEATQNFTIVKTSHSKISDYRKALKIQAIKAAKDKATYLAESIGEKSGEAVTIEEPVESEIYPQPMYANTIMYKKATANESDPSDEGGQVDFQKIKLRFEVRAVFALK
ncbi:MAG: hypothetical protein C5B52_03400 [Bacteroidetes bacterium]|nr:MAG: hypothetical protein C5B52_03400 [Bacteroidota bacterium]